MKRIPYGISNFEVLREEDYLYVDKTSYIELLDRYAPYNFFMRPRRFGKSKMVQEELGDDDLKKVLIIVVGKKDIDTVEI